MVGTRASRRPRRRTSSENARASATERSTPMAMALDRHPVNGARFLIALAPALRRHFRLGIAGHQPEPLRAERVLVVGEALAPDLGEKGLGALADGPVEVAVALDELGFEVRVHAQKVVANQDLAVAVHARP